SCFRPETGLNNGTRSARLWRTHRRLSIARAHPLPVVVGYPLPETTTPGPAGRDGGCRPRRPVDAETPRSCVRPDYSGCYRIGIPPAWPAPAKTAGDGACGLQTDSSMVATYSCYPELRPA